MINANTPLLKRVDERGWRMGLTNLLRKENGDWWRTRRWLVQILVWTVIINGILAVVLWQDKPESARANAGNGVSVDMNDPLQGSLMIFIMGAGLSTAMGIVVLMQDSVIGEKQSGTAPWILSKPVSRAAFIIAKLTANSIAAIVIMIAAQSAIAYFQVSQAGSIPILTNWLVGSALLALSLLFYLTLTLMLGTFFRSRTPVIGIPLAVLFAQQLIPNVLPALKFVMPWAITWPLDGNLPLSMLAMQGQPLWTIVPVLTTSGFIIVFVGIALWRFKREEF